MKSTFKSDHQKELIVAEFLLGGSAYRVLGEKHKVNFTTLHSWVMKFNRKMSSKGKTSRLLGKGEPTDSTPLPTDVKELQEELRKAKLHAELLNAIIDIAEVELKIDIRKKSGTKR